MPDSPSTTPDPPASIPPEDPGRGLTLARPDSDESNLPHISLAGDTYTVLLTGDDTAGRYTLIDMYVPPGGGPPPHRHDFEESFSVLEGEIEVTFREAKSVVRAGETVHVPASAPHSFSNAAGQAARLLCTCSPPGQEDFFMAVGDVVKSRTAPPPDLDDTSIAERRVKAQQLAPRYRTELML